MSRQFVLEKVTALKCKPELKSRTFKSTSPSGAARKAASKLYKSGKCNFTVVMREVESTPAGSPVLKNGNIVPTEKLFKYKVTREKLDVPVRLPGRPTITHKFKVKSAK